MNKQNITNSNLEKTQLSVNERKALSLEIMDLIHNFCIQNNIKYLLHAGTLLGAIRHKGFIPWDDDLDICMPRPDYEKFRQIFKIEGYSISFWGDEKRLCLPFIKVYSNKTYAKTPKGRDLPFGLGIDIFPIDGYPESEKEIKKYFKKQDFIFKYGYLLAKSIEYPNLWQGNILKYIPKLILKFTIFIFFKSPYFAKIINKNAIKNDYNKSKTAGCSVALYRHKLEIVDKDCFENYKLMKFENKEYFVSNRYEEILESLYGPDYMTPPPVDKRNSIHLEHYYWKK